MNNFYKDFFNYLTNNIPKSKKQMKQRTTDIRLHKNQNHNLKELMYKSFSLKNMSEYATITVFRKISQVFFYHVLVNLRAFIIKIAVKISHYIIQQNVYTRSN